MRSSSYMQTMPDSGATTYKATTAKKCTYVASAHPKFDEEPFASVGHQRNYFSTTDVPLSKDVHRLAMYAKLCYDNADVHTNTCMEQHDWKGTIKGMSRGENEGFADVYKGDGTNPTIVGFPGTNSKSDAWTDIDMRRVCLNEPSEAGISLKYPSSYLDSEEMDTLETQGRRLPYDKTKKDEQPSVACSTGVCSCDKLHQGFVEQYLHSREEIMDLVRDTTGPVEVTGHSLGAALATICAVDIREHLKRDVKCITFASPRVGNGSFGERYRNSVVEGSLRIICRLDTVPRLPVAVRFTHVTDEVILGHSRYRNVVTIWGGFLLHSIFGLMPHTLVNYLNELKERKTTEAK